MIIDKLTEFADAVSMDQETGTYNMGNQIDLGAVTRDIGQGEPVYLIINVDLIPTDGGDSATATFRLVSDDSASIATNGTATQHLVTGSFLKTQLPTGTRFVFTLPAGGPAYERYLGFQMTVGTAGFDTGNVSAWLSLDPNGWRAYPQGDVSD